MKPALSVLASALLDSSPSLSLAQNKVASEEIYQGGAVAASPSVEDAVVTVRTTTSGTTNLKSFLELTSAQMQPAPSIAFKTGSADRPVPTMNLEQVRFGYLLEALEQLVDVRFNLMNPRSKVGESPLLIVEDQTPRLHVTRWQTNVTKIPEEASLTAIQRAPETAADAEGAPIRSSSNSPANPIVGTPGVSPAPSGYPNNPVALVVSESNRLPAIPGTGYPNPGITWHPGAVPQVSKPITSSYAIGSLVNEEKSGQTTEQVIEAIDLPWTTTDETNKNSRIALHKPSSLLIIKASGEFQTLAREVIENLNIAQTQRQEASMHLGRLSQMKLEFVRDRDHRQALHEETLKRLKTGQASELEKYRLVIAELESRIREFQHESDQQQGILARLKGVHSIEVDKLQINMAELQSQLEVLKSKAGKGGN